MKATGIVRRVDDLGRVVIPKEIRRSMRIREGDPLEIYLTKEGVVFAPYTQQAANRAEKARVWLHKNADYLEKRKASFTMSPSGETTCTFYQVAANNQIMEYSGKTKRNPSDEYSTDVAMVYAYLRACGYSDKRIEEEVFEEF